MEKLISKSLKKLENLSKVWGSSDFDGKRILHKTLFPDGIYFNAENHQYLTRKVNGFVELVSSISTVYCGNKKGNFQNNIENSRPVPRIGKLSNQIIRDLLAFGDVDHMKRPYLT